MADLTFKVLVAEVGAVVLSFRVAGFWNSLLVQSLGSRTVSEFGVTQG